MKDKKHCHACNKTLELDQFYKDVSRKDGHDNRCKSCSKKRQATRTKYADRKEGLARYYLKNGEKIRARARVRTALKKGEIKKGQCEYRIFECFGRLEAHHHDYSKPLEVKWLCARHHKMYEQGKLS